MLVRRMAFLLISALAYCALTSPASAAPFGVGDFVSYSQENWGGDPGTNPAAQMLVDRFMGLYGGGVEVGIPGNGGNSMILTSAAAILNYLPTSGSPASLPADVVDPNSTSSGLLGGFVLALQLDVDFNDAGYLHGTNAVLFGDLVLTQLVYGPEFDGYTVRQFLQEANRRLGGGVGTASYDDLAALAQDMSNAFDAGSPSAFAQSHLTLPARSVPEPATWMLVMLGLAAFLLARPKSLHGVRH